MVPLDRFTVVLDACTIFPMLVRDVLLTLAGTFNIADFAEAHLKEHLEIEVLHPDDFVMDLVDLNEKRAVAAFRELRARGSLAGHRPHFSRPLSWQIRTSPGAP
jgi:hypothetical protein